ncbi:hypothetical protein TYRP_019285, partial [Tyrophagus putrescentiae]
MQAAKINPIKLSCRATAVRKTVRNAESVEAANRFDTLQIERKDKASVPSALKLESSRLILFQDLSKVSTHVDQDCLIGKPRFWYLGALPSSKKASPQIDHHQPSAISIVSFIQSSLYNGVNGASYSY